MGIGCFMPHRKLPLLFDPNLTRKEDLVGRMEPLSNELIPGPIKKYVNADLLILLNSLYKGSGVSDKCFFAMEALEKDEQQIHLKCTLNQVQFICKSSTKKIKAKSASLLKAILKIYKVNNR